MSKQVKELIMREYTSRFEGAGDALLIGIRALKGQDTTRLRNNLAKKKIKVTVLRNSLARKTLGTTALAPLTEHFSGASALAYGGASAVEIAREIVSMMEKMPAIELKAALLDGQLFKGKDGVKELSRFPTKDEAIAKVVTLVVTPARNVMGQVKGPGAGIAGLIKAIEARLEKGEEIKKAG